MTAPFATDLETVAAALTDVTGLRVQLRPALTRRLLADLERAGSDPRAAVEQVRAGGATRDALIESTVIAESYVFRDRGQFGSLAELLPALVRAEPTRPVRILSAGCAGGEEAYSLAITAVEQGVDDRVAIDAVDLSGAAIARAERGTYGHWSLRGTDLAERRRWFEHTIDGYRVRDRFRTVRFRRANLVDPPSDDEAYDLILCRHVLVHMTPTGATRAVEGLLARLQPGGWLLTAASDPPITSHLVRSLARPVGLYRKVGPATVVPTAEATGDRPSSAAASTPQRRPPPRRHTAATAVAPEAGHQTAAGPTSPAHHVLGLRRQRRLEDAERAAQLALAERPDDPELLTAYAGVLLDLGRHDAASDTARSATYLDAGEPVAHLYLALAHRAAGDPGRARVAFRTARRLLEGLPPDAPLALADGERVARLACLAADHEQLCASAAP